MALAIGAFITLGNSLCKTTMYSTQMSPDSKYKVVHQMVDCGATTNSSTSVLIYRASFPYFPSNILGFDGEYADKELVVNWDTPSNLRIYFTGESTDIRKIAFHAKGVEVEVYENGSQLNYQRVEDIEKEIVKEQTTYNVVLPQGSRWIEVSQ